MNLQLADILLFALYAITTVLLVVWTRRSAEAANRSAKAAEKSAEAAERSAVAAEAQAQVAKQSLDAQIAQGRRDLMPVFVEAGGGSGKGDVFYRIPIANQGAPVTEVRLVGTQGPLQLEVPTRHYLKTGEILDIRIKTPAAGWFEIGFIDARQQEGSVWLYCDGKKRIIAREAGQPPVSGSELADWLASRGVQ